MKEARWAAAPPGLLGGGAVQWEDKVSELKNTAGPTGGHNRRKQWVVDF